MGTSEVDSGKKGCFGSKRKKNLGPLHTGKLFGYMVSNFSADWSKMKKTGKGLQKLGLNWRHWFHQEVGFWVFL